MAKKKTWTVPVIKGTNIAWTEIWNSYDVELDECAPEEYKFDATIKFAGIPFISFLETVSTILQTILTYDSKSVRIYFNY